jgi:short-subunit dehydrogenase
MKHDLRRYRTALITGASSGIGEAFAEALARQGLDLILVARSQERLEEVAVRLALAHDRRVEVISADLAKPQPGAALLKKVRALDMDVDLLINNAGFGIAGGNFHENDPARQQQMLALNVGAVMDLTHTFLPAMVERKTGAIINVASLAGFQPTPYLTVYGATKAFVLALSEGLWAEYRSKGIAVLAVCPGPVDTAFFEATGDPGMRDLIPPGTMLTAPQVVSASLKALAQGKSFVVPGAIMKAASLLPRLLPRGAVARVSARTMKQR